VRLASGELFAAVGALKMGDKAHAASVTHPLGQTQAPGYRVRRR
jgi:hypothetical protein